jgi:hypothetical protein
MSNSANPVDPPALAAVRQWLETAVIGMNLCPFARAVHVRGQIRWVVLDGVDDPQRIRECVESELEHLQQVSAEQTDTTLIVLTDALPDFFDFSRFADSLNSLLKRMGLRGVMQIASFHPQFEFSGEDPQSASHFSNRAPFPVIHLLREQSMQTAVEKFGDTDRIWQANIDRLESMSQAELEQVFPHGNWAAKP